MIEGNAAKNLSPENLNLQEQPPKLRVIDGGLSSKDSRILEITNKLKERNWTNEQISQKIVEGILKNNTEVSEIKGKNFISDQLRNNLSKKGIDIPSQKKLDEIVVEKGMKEVITTDTEKEIDKLFPKQDEEEILKEIDKINAKKIIDKEERDKKGKELIAEWKKKRDAKKEDDKKKLKEKTAELLEEHHEEKNTKKEEKSTVTTKQETLENKFFTDAQPAIAQEKRSQIKQVEMDKIGTSAKLYQKLGTEEKTIIDLFSSQENSTHGDERTITGNERTITGGERAREYIENTNYLNEVKPKELNNLKKYLKNDHTIYKDLTIEIDSMLPEKELADEEYENFVKDTDKEDRAIKKLNKHQKLDLETLVDLRKADEKGQITFNNYLNGLEINNQIKILSILENRPDTRKWIENWFKTEEGKSYQTLSKITPKKKSMWGKIKSIFSN